MEEADGSVHTWTNPFSDFHGILVGFFALRRLEVTAHPPLPEQVSHIHSHSQRAYSEPRALRAAASPCAELREKQQRQQQWRFRLWNVTDIFRYVCLPVRSFWRDVKIISSTPDAKFSGVTYNPWMSCQEATCVRHTHVNLYVQTDVTTDAGVLLCYGTMATEVNL